MIHGNIAIYPLTDSFLSVARYMILHMNCEDCFVFVKPKGYPIKLESLSTIKNDRTGQIVLTEDIDKAIVDSDVFLIADGNIDGKFRSKVITKIWTAIQANKQIISTLKFTPEEKEMFSGYNKQLHCYSNKDNELPHLLSEIPKISQPKSVVIGVGRIHPELDSLGITLIINDQLKRMGYRVNTILDNSYARFLNMFPIPEFLYNGLYSLPDIVLSLNHYVEAIERSSHADITLVQLPGGMMKYDDTVPADLGVYSYIFSQSIQIDHLFCCFPFHYLTADYIEKISKVFSIKYGCGLSAAFLSHKMINIQSSIESSSPMYLRVPDTIYNDRLKYLIESSNNIPIFELMEKCEDNLENISNVLSNLFPDSLFPLEGECRSSGDNKDCPASILLHLMHSKFSVPECFLTGEYDDMPLTEEPFRFDAQDLTYLFLEIEKTLKIHIDTHKILNQEFNTISGISKIIERS
jgi:peptide maturation system protein (TIGR04066 family)